MKEPTYRQTLAHAWRVVWHNKILWFLGLFSVMLGQLGFSDIFGRLWSVSDVLVSGQGVILLPGLNLNLSGGVWDILGFVWIVGICLALLLLFVFLAVTSQGALISYAAQWFKTKKHQKLSGPWNHSLKHFWNILFINILRKVLLVVLLVAIGFALNKLIYSETLPQGFVFAVSLVVALFVALFVSIISIYALCALVVDGKGLVSAIKKSWAIFSEHLLVSLEVGVVLMLLNFVLALVVLTGAFVAFLPAMLIWIAAGITSTVVLAAVGFALGVFLLLVFIILVAGFFNAFTTSAWVFLYMKMHKEGISSRTIHFFKHLFSR